MDQEIIAKAREAKSAEELLAMAKENDIELTGEQAKEYYDRLHASGELSDDELDNVAGGGCGSFETKCPRCGCKDYDLSDRTYTVTVPHPYHQILCHYNKCRNCGHEFQ